MPMKNRLLLHPIFGAAFLAFVGLSSHSHAQAPNPLGVEWVGGSQPAPTQPPAGSRAPASNPLGVDWVGGSQPAPAQPPAGSRAPASNPLGVDWVGGSQPVPTQPPAGSRAPASNPLGVEWVGGSQPAPTQPPAGSRAPANNPLGIEWQTGAPVTNPVTGGGSQQPPPPPPPPPPATQGSNTPATVLVSTWNYLAVAFSDAKGTVSETRGVSGTLVFKPDGRYEQALYIGGVLNALKGTYRVNGNRLETTYTWRGQSVTDTFEMYLDPTGKKLTLKGSGSPTSLYTLQRAE